MSLPATPTKRICAICGKKPNRTGQTAGQPLLWASLQGQGQISTSQAQSWFAQ